MQGDFSEVPTGDRKSATVWLVPLVELAAVPTVRVLFTLTEAGS